MDAHIHVYEWTSHALCRYGADDFSCTGVHSISFIIISAVTLFLFVPFGLSASLVFHESDANSKSIVAKAQGFESMCVGRGARPQFLQSPN